MRKILISLALIALSFSAEARPRGGQGHAFVCDVAPCVAAYSLDGAMRGAYYGPLFQLTLASNHALTLDVGQATDRKTDMTTWSAFCGGVASNCLVSKIYDQVAAGGVNDLVPSTVNAPFGPDCTGGPVICAAVFAINGTTSLPEIVTGTGANGVHSPAPEYFIAGDASATGMPYGNRPESILFVGMNSATAPQCCGFWGTEHVYNLPSSDPLWFGGDFGVDLQFGRFGSYGCVTTGVYCANIDMEQGSTSEGYVFTFVNSSPINVIVISEYNQTGNNLIERVNNNTVVGSALTFLLQPGNHIHFGGGGDLSQPAVNTFREGAFWNSTLSDTEAFQVYSLALARQSGLTFPNPP